MRREKAQKLVKDWTNRICNHPCNEEEFFLGKPTGNIICAVCGKKIGKKSTLKLAKNILKKRI
jgi:ribosomal protein S27E